MLTLETVKEHLRIDFDEDDSYLRSLLNLGLAYLQGACDNFDTLYGRDSNFTSIADSVIMSIVYESYMNRDRFQESSKVNIGMSYLLRSMITQLQYYNPESDSKPEDLEDVEND